MNELPRSLACNSRRRSTQDDRAQMSIPALTRDSWQSEELMLADDYPNAARQPAEDAKPLITNSAMNRTGTLNASKTPGSCLAGIRIGKKRAPERQNSPPNVGLRQ